MTIWFVEYSKLMDSNLVHRKFLTFYEMSINRNKEQIVKGDQKCSEGRGAKISHYS